MLQRTTTHQINASHWAKERPHNKFADYFIPYKRAPLELTLNTLEFTACRGEDLVGLFEARGKSRKRCRNFEDFCPLVYFCQNRHEVKQYRK